jgi:hypothetical protein
VIVFVEGFVRKRGREVVVLVRRGASHAHCVIILGLGGIGVCFFPLEEQCLRSLLKPESPVQGSDSQR